MKVLFITNQLNLGGIETNIVRLTRALVDRGHRVVTASSGGELVPKLTAAGGEHLELHISGGPAQLVRTARTLSNHLRRDPVDIVHLFSASAVAAWLPARLLLSGSGAPPAVSSVMGLQDSPTESASKTRLRVLVTSLGVRKLIIMAPAIDEMVRRLPLSPGRLAHLSVVGVETATDPSWAPRSREEARRELGVQAHQKVVMTIGNLAPRKSHELFIRAASQVLLHRDDVRFFIVGEGQLRADLEGEIARSSSPEAITLLGARLDVDRLLPACDVYVRPGVVEGFIGITVLEAQALGIPVISFETEDVKLAVKDGLTGRLVPARDHSALARAMIELLDDRDLAARLGLAGRDHVETAYSISVVADSLLRLYSEVLASR